MGSIEIPLETRTGRREPTCRIHAWLRSFRPRRPNQFRSIATGCSCSATELCASRSLTDAADRFRKLGNGVILHGVPERLDRSHRPRDDRIMWNPLSYIRQWFGRKARRADGLTAVEYEAVALIAYEGRAAYNRAREQAEYCLSRG